MVFRKLTLATAAIGMAMMPAAAIAAPAERAAAPLAETSALGGDSEFGNALIIILLAAAGMAVLLLTDDDPDSP